MQPCHSCRSMAIHSGRVHIALLADGTGKFHNAADLRAKPLRTKSLPQYSQWPLTVEMWVKLPEDKKSRYNLLVANLPGSERGNWEVYTTPLNGLLTASVNDKKRGRHPTLRADHRWPVALHRDDLRWGRACVVC